VRDDAVDAAGFGLGRGHFSSERLLY
jgi:hypothetical protein